MNKTAPKEGTKSNPEQKPHQVSQSKQDKRYTLESHLALSVSNSCPQNPHNNTLKQIDYKVDPEFFIAHIPIVLASLNHEVQLQEKQQAQVCTSYSSYQKMAYNTIFRAIYKEDQLLSRAEIQYSRTLNCILFKVDRSGPKLAIVYLSNDIVIELAGLIKTEIHPAVLMKKTMETNLFFFSFGVSSFRVIDDTIFYGTDSISNLRASKFKIYKKEDKELAFWQMTYYWTDSGFEIIGLELCHSKRLLLITFSRTTKGVKFILLDENLTKLHVFIVFGFEEIRLLEDKPKMEIVTSSHSTEIKFETKDSQKKLICKGGKLEVIIFCSDYFFPKEKKRQVEQSSKNHTLTSYLPVDFPQEDSTDITLNPPSQPTPSFISDEPTQECQEDFIVFSF